MGTVCVPIWLSLFLTLSMSACVQGGKKLFCYYSSDAQYRQGLGKFLPENIDSSLCTHVIFAFFQPTEDGLNVRAVGWNDLGQEGLYARTVRHKDKNPALRVLLAIGGWVIGSDPFLPIIRSQQTMTTFARNLVQFLRQNRMDGMDMDWEFPGVRGSTPADKPKFTMLLKILQEEFTSEAARTGKEKLILTLATAAGAYYINEGYEPEEIVKYPDYLLLMTYNYHGSWENVTGHPSAVWSHPTLDTGYRQELNMLWTVNFWLSKGAKPEKLILGLATYGMTFRLTDPQQNGILAPAIVGGGSGGRYTRESGIISYYEVCENLDKYGWTRKWIPEQKVNYAFGPYNNEYQWVGYDDPISTEVKVSTLIIGKGLAGAFVWSVEMDDFNGVCNQGKYPLLQTIVRAMGGLDPAPFTGQTEQTLTRGLARTPAKRRTTQSQSQASPLDKRTSQRGRRSDSRASHPLGLNSDSGLSLRASLKEILVSVGGLLPAAASGQRATDPIPAWTPPVWTTPVWTTPAPSMSPAPVVYQQTTPARSYTDTTATGLINSPSSTCAARGRSGVFKDPSFCGQFVYCVQALPGQYLQYTMRCPPGLSFNDQYLTCVYDSTCRNRY